jgi:type IV secretory pathway VirB4 component
VSKQVSSSLSALLVQAIPTLLQQAEGFKTTLPSCMDHLMVTRNMDTTSLATTFPFTSSELTSNEGILYGINQHNGSLVIFDRFTLENANTVVFAKAGAGKSYTVKLEILRSLMFGTEVIIIDPENEYKTLCDAVGGEYLNFSFNSQNRINPFDLSLLTQYSEENELNLKIQSLFSMFKVIMGTLNPTEEALLDRAINLAYKMKGITMDPATQKRTPPLIEDLYKAFIGMEEPLAISMADRLERFVKGSFTGIIDQPSNVQIRNQFTVFSVRDLEDSLKPIAIFLILDYIWTKMRRDLKKRILVVDEAWYLMRYPDSANFLYGIAKRARKYFLGLTTITQDVEDFLNTDFGKAIVTNSSIQILMKQSPAGVDKIAQVFYLSEGEKHLLLSANVGEGLFFAGNNHVAVRFVASPDEHKLITTKPSEILARAQAQTAEKPRLVPSKT